ncbi:MAG: tetratricopeptide repeat protein [Chlorobi bacterium]|nr:tetratricopeptide repeat protein [Chlorobiota bacterium]
MEPDKRKASLGKLNKQYIFSITAIMLFTIIVFSNSINNEILYGWDDGEYIENQDIRDFNVRAFFSEYYLGMYQPLAIFSFAINYISAKDNPVPYHTTNLFLHLFNVFLVFLLFQKLTNRIEISFAVSLLFAIHPMHVEAVAWIATRSNGLYSLFYLASLIAYINYIKDNSYLWLAVSFVLFLLSCFSKSMAITLPLTLLLLDYYYSRKINFRLFIEKTPFLFISIVFGLISIKAATDFGHLQYLDQDYTLLNRLFLISYSIVFYIVRVFVPVNLSAVYAYPDINSGVLPYAYYGSFFILTIIMALAFKSGKLRKTIIFGLMWFIINISIVLPLMWSRMLMLADRYTYIPYLGLFFILAKVYAYTVNSQKPLIKKFRPIIYSTLVIWIVFLVVKTYQSNNVWKNSESLVTNVINNERSDKDLSIGYFFRGNIYDKKQDFKAALKDFTKAIELNSGYTMAYNNRGIIKGIMNDMKGAYDDFSMAIEKEPDYADAWYNRGNVLFYIKKNEEACQNWHKASELGSLQAEKIYRQYCK